MTISLDFTGRVVFCHLKLIVFVKLEVKYSVKRQVVLVAVEGLGGAFVP